MSYPLALSPGQRVGPYCVAAALRSGGMASLYLAHRTGPEGFARPVALKVVHPHLSQDAQFVRMFLDEALLCARIRHPNVVHVEELGEHAGAYYLAMEYVDGCSLADVIDGLHVRGERMDPRIAVSIACSVLEGLHATHTVKGDHGEALDVVHRDVSPSNVLIDRTGHVKLIDFGIARARGRAVETSAGTLKGKYAYMSPEQAFGREIDARTDIYAAAVVLWEMLATRPLFEAASDLALLELARAAKIPNLTEVVPSIPTDLAAVVAWALTSDRDKRPGSARELRKALLDAFPAARELDSSEIAQLLSGAGLLPSGPPKPPPAHSAVGAPTLPGTPTPGVASQPDGEPTADLGRSSQAIATNVTLHRSRSLWILGVVTLSLGVFVALRLMRTTHVAPPPLPAATAPLAAPWPKDPSPAHSLSEPPRAVAPEPDERAPAVKAPVPVSESARPGKRSRDGSRERKTKANKRGLVDGVPIVDQPGF